MSKTNRRFYWLKLLDDFFEQREIKKLRMIAGGDTYTIIYLKLQLLSLKTEGDIFFEATEKDIYEQLSLELDEKLDDVKMTLLFLIDNKLIDIFENQNLELIQTKELIGVTTAGALRVRKHRAKKKELEEKNFIENNQKDKKALHCNTHVTKCNGDIDIELDIDKDIESCCNDNTNNKLDRESNKITDSQQQQILINDVEDVFKKLELKSNYKEFYQHYSLLNWKFHNNNSISLRALPKLAKNWEDNYLSKLKDNSLPEQVKKPDWLDEYVNELEKMEV